MSKRSEATPDVGVAAPVWEAREFGQGPRSAEWLARAAQCLAPMGPKRAPGATSDGIVYARGEGARVVDADGRTYVDLAAGFGALILGHGHPRVVRAIREQSAQLLQALGDVYPSTTKIALAERLCASFAPRSARAIIGQSGADAVTAALKTAVLATGRPAVVAFAGSYHGLSYAPLSASGLRSSYRDPFVSHLGMPVSFVEYPSSEAMATAALSALDTALSKGDVGAVLFEPILGRGGCLVPPRGFLAELTSRARAAGALTIADEIWTGLGRSGALLRSRSEGADADLVCFGKGLGGGLPISACVGEAAVMQAWSRDAEVVDTSTFAGAPLACAAALSTLDVLEEDALVARSERVGAWWQGLLREALGGRVADVRGAGLMVGVDLGGVSRAVALQRALLRAGYVTSTGGGSRDVLVLTPPLNIEESILSEFVPVLRRTLDEIPQ